MDPGIIHTKIPYILKSPTLHDLYQYLIGTLMWDTIYTANLFKYLRERIIDILQSNRESMYMKIDTIIDKKSKHVIVDNMMSDVLEKIIENPSILEYNPSTEKFNDEDLKTIMQGITEDATVRTDPESAEDYLKAHKLNKPKLWELAGNYKGGKRSKNNKKKSKRKHQHNKKSRKKRR